MERVGGPFHLSAAAHLGEIAVQGGDGRCVCDGFLAHRIAGDPGDLHLPVLVLLGGYVDDGALRQERQVRAVVIERDCQLELRLASPGDRLSSEQTRPPA